MDPDPNAQRQPVYPQQYPPQYPQQYPPQAYPPPYYMPYQPPKKKDRTLLIVVVVVVIFIVAPIIMAAVMYSLVIGLAPSAHVIPTGTWGARTVMSPTQVNVDFGRVNPEPMPVDLEIILIRNGTVEGLYIFMSNDDGALALAHGTNVGTLVYHDLADNQKINIGDQLRLTNLNPTSDYRLVMIWGPTGDQITSTTFYTP